MASDDVRLGLIEDLHAKKVNFLIFVLWAEGGCLVGQNLKMRAERESGGTHSSAGNMPRVSEDRCTLTHPKQGMKLL